MKNRAEQQRYPFERVVIPVTGDNLGNSSINLILATEDVLCSQLGIDLSKETIRDIQCRYNAKTYVRRDQREAA